MRKLIASIGAAAWLMAAGSVAAAQEPQQPQPQQPHEHSAQAEERKMVQGELLQVDTDNRMIIVRTTADTPMSFRYDDKTEVAGAQDTIAGLATTSGERVTVHYTEDESGVRTAKKIQVNEQEEQGTI